jgi:hypothetical protein
MSNLAFLYVGSFFYIYVESLSSYFMHELREYSCHSDCSITKIGRPNKEALVRVSLAPQDMNMPF